MFINLSNHPSSEWSEQQLAAARTLGTTIVDINFPYVRPMMTTAEVMEWGKALADEILDTLAEGGDDASDNVVHVMGEHTLTYAVVARLQACGVWCVASTTERDTEQQPDGAKLSHFGFVSFRNYPTFAIAMPGDDE